MTARIIDGKAVARKLRAEYAARIERLKTAHHLVPGIAVILVGDNPASQVYVRNKISACRDTGIRSEMHHLPADTPEPELEPSEPARVVSYGLDGLPPQVLRW